MPEVKERDMKNENDKTPYFMFLCYIGLIFLYLIAGIAGMIIDFY